jgi:hypothetical protein
VEAQGEAAARARGYIAALGEADETLKLGALGGLIEPLLRHCGRSVDGDPAQSRRSVARFTETKEDDAVREETGWEIARASGLAQRIDRRLTPRAQPVRPQVEIWRVASAR